MKASPVSRFAFLLAGAAAAAGFVTAGCGRGGGSTAAADSSAPAAVRAEQTMAVSPEALGDEVAVKVRQAARDYVQEVYPHARVEGVYTRGYWYGNLYLAGADMVNGADRRTLDLLVRRYVRENGSEYWRAEGYGDSAAMASLTHAANNGAAAASEAR